MDETKKIPSVVRLKEAPGKFTLVNRFPDQITHRFDNALWTGFLFGIGLAIGLLLTVLVILGAVGVLAFLISP